MEAIGRFPEVFEGMDDVLNDHRVGSVACDRRLDFPQLGLLAIDQYQPGSLVLGITALCFGEQRFDHLGRGLAQAGPHPSVPHRGSEGLGFVQTHDLLGRARIGVYLVHRSDRGHPLAVALLAPTEAGLEFALRLFGGLARGLPQVLLAHHHAFSVYAHHHQTGSSFHRPTGIELINIHADRPRQWFGLSLRYLGSRSLRNGLHRFIK
jgi:hypothetical protein